jgi:hypothetical protein
MASTFSPNLRIELIGYGEQNNTWGNTTNTNLGTLIEQSIAGQAAVNVTAGNVTLTAVNGATDQARQMILGITGTPGTARTVTAPSVSKVYVVANGSDSTVTIKMATGTGVPISAGKAKFVYCNGTDFYEATTEQASAAITNLTVSGTLTASGTITGTGFSNYLASPPAIGSTTASTGKFTDLTSTGTITGTGFSNYLASPPAIGSTTASTGKFTDLTSTGNTILGDASADTVTINGTIQPGVVVSGSSSSNALRITQTGSGNALLVEDDTNPDSTPFIVDSAGNIGQGLTSVTTTGFTGGYIAKSSTAFGPQLVYENATNDSSGPYYILQKGRAGAVVQSGDTLGNFQLRGFDGTNFIRGASIEAAVDGTPGTNDMPGRLIFGTTADGASSPTERMRIDNAGRVTFGPGTSLYSDTSLASTKSMFGAGATTAYGVRQIATVASDVTANAIAFQASLTTQATAFTLNNIRGFVASGATIGAGSAINNQYGFVAESGITTATNNYGFYANIASGSGRYNFYAAGTADNYFAGAVGIGQTPPDSRLHVRQDQDGITRTIIQNRNATGTPLSELTFISSTFSLADNRYAYIQSGGGGSAYLSFGTSNAGAPTERMQIAANGYVGIGTAPAAPFHVQNASTSVVAIIAASSSTTCNFVLRNSVTTSNNTRVAADSSDLTLITGGTERMRVTSTGNIHGTSGTTAMTDGFFYIPSAAGAPSGVPTAIAGRVPMYYDTTNNNFYVYNGAWKKVLLV